MKIPFLSTWQEKRRVQSMTVRELFETRYLPQRLPDGTRSTLHTYAVTLRHLDRFLGREATIADLTNDQIAKFQAKRLETVKANSLRQNMNCIFALWRYAFHKKLTTEWPDLKALKLEHKVPRALTETEISRVWQAIQADFAMVRAAKAHRALFNALDSLGDIEFGSPIVCGDGRVAGSGGTYPVKVTTSDPEAVKSLIEGDPHAVLAN